MIETTSVKYHPKQIEALKYLSAKSDVSKILYGGGVFSGKSFFGCDWQIKRRLKYPNTKGLIGRAELKKLRLSTMQTFFELLTVYNIKPGIHYTYNGQDHVIKWYNGSQTILMDLADMPSDPDFQRFGSIEITDYFIDEAAEVSKRCVDILHSRVRYRLINDKPKGLMTCNPSKGWLYNEFYLPNKNGELSAEKAFVKALPTDNPYMSESYYKNLLLLPPHDQERLLKGNWEFDDDASKMFFTNDLNAMFRQEPATGKKYITADIARLGEDKTVVILWDELTVVQITTLEKKRIDEICEFIRGMRDIHQVPLKNIICDEDGIGSGAVDTLRCTGFKNGSAATKPKDYANLKSECYFLLANYVSSGKIAVNLSGDVTEIKNRIIQEFETIRRANMDKDTRLSVVGKKEIKAKYSFSPDHADAMMMRMYYELHPNKGNYMLR